MNKKFSKLIVNALCVTTLFMVAGSIPALAETNQNVNQSTEIKISKVKKGNAYIPEGTIVEIELTETISSKKIKKGDTVPLKLVSNLLINDVVVAPAGTEVKGFVSDQRKAGGFGKGGKLEIKVVSFKSVNGVEIPLEFAEMTKGKKDSGGVAVEIEVSAVGSFLMKGKNVTIDEGTKFDVAVTADTDLNISLKDLPYIAQQ